MVDFDYLTYNNCDIISIYDNNSSHEQEVIIVTALLAKEKKVRKEKGK